MHNTLKRELKPSWSETSLPEESQVITVLIVQDNCFEKQIKAKAQLDSPRTRVVAISTGIHENHPQNQRCLSYNLQMTTAIIADVINITEADHQRLQLHTRKAQLCLMRVILVTNLQLCLQQLDT